MRWARIASVAMALLLAGCGGGGGGGDGTDDWLYPLWVSTDVAVADVDGDGRNDVITLGQLATSASARDGRLVVHRQTAAGVFAAAENYVVGTYPWRFAVADIDGDRALDFAVADTDADAAWILLQDPNHRGRLLAPRQVASGFAAYGVTIADLNGDGAPDLVVTDCRAGSGRAVLLPQDPLRRGTFGSAVSLSVPGSATCQVAAGDLDGDARDDLALSITQSSGGSAPDTVLGIVLQQPDGTLGPVATVAPKHGLNVARLSIDDYDGDGANDVFAYYTPFSIAYDATLSVLLQRPIGGGFAAPADTPVGDLRGLDDAVFADLDGDGRPDAVLTGFFPVGSPSVVNSRLNRFTQSGGGAFAVVSNTELPFAASRLTAGDVDGDGRNEIVVLGDEGRYLVVD